MYIDVCRLRSLLEKISLTNVVYPAGEDFELVFYTCKQGLIVHTKHIWTYIDAYT